MIRRFFFKKITLSYRKKIMSHFIRISINTNKSLMLFKIVIKNYDIIFFLLLTFSLRRQNYNIFLLQ